MTQMSTNPDVIDTEGKNHDIYYDGASHYYIDGSVYKKRRENAFTCI